MAKAKVINQEFVRGDQYVFRVNIPLDLDGYRLDMQLRDDPDNANALATASSVGIDDDPESDGYTPGRIEVISVSNTTVGNTTTVTSKVECTLDTAATQPLPALNLFYDLQIAPINTGQPLTVLRGRMLVIPDVTRNTGA